MINELEHIKLSFAELPVVETDNSWLSYQFRNAGEAWIIFALETRDGGKPQWRRIHASFGLDGRALYGGFKQGAAWEIHSQQRLLRGKKVKVESYLSELNRLPLTPLSQLGPFRPVAHKSLDEHGLKESDVYFDYHWDKSGWTPVDRSEPAAFEVPLNSRQNVAYVSCVSGPSEVFLTKDSPTPIFVPSSNLELFA